MLADSRAALWPWLAGCVVVACCAGPLMGAKLGGERAPATRRVATAPTTTRAFGPLAVRQTSLGFVPPGALPQTLAVSPDARQVAVVGVVDNGLAAIVNGQDGPPFDSVRDLTFSRNGARLAYAALRGEEWQVVHGDALSKPYPRVGRITLSPDGSRAAFVATRIQGQWLVADGKEFGPFDTVLPPVFSGDGRRLAAAVQRSGQWMLLVDGKEGQERFASASSVALSADGSRLGAEVQRDGQWRILCDGRLGPEFDGTTAPLFSADGKRMAYAGRRGRKWSFVVDGRETGTYDLVGGRPAFSPDGQRWGGTARRNGKWLVIVDGIESKEYIAADAGRLALASGRWACPVTSSSGELLLTEAGEGKPHDNVARPAFSPDGRRLAFIAVRGESAMVVVDGVEGTACDEVVAGPAFSPDGRHVAYVASRAQRDVLVVDGQEGPDYDTLARGAALIFDGPDTLHTLGSLDDELILVEARIGPTTPNSPPGRQDAR